MNWTDFLITTIALFAIIVARYFLIAGFFYWALWKREGNILRARKLTQIVPPAQLIRSEDLAGRVDWQMLHFLDAERCPVEMATAPKEVETVVNHRVINRRHVIVGVSGDNDPMDGQPHSASNYRSHHVTEISRGDGKDDGLARGRAGQLCVRVKVVDALW